ncbi:MAG: hypothetical protein ACK4VN_02155 [Bacteroidales bacterium]
MFKKLYFISTISLCFTALVSVAQDALMLGNAENSFFRTIRANQHDSYITLGGGLGNMEPLIFEAFIAPYFLLRTSDNSRWGATLSPSILLRMYAEESFPVRTPSYMPQVTFYRQLDDKQGRALQYVFLSVVHHSNGQDDSFFMEDGTLNTLSGDFSTNYLELGMFFNKKLVPFSQTTEYFKTSLECHLDFYRSKELKGRYSFVRWNNSIRVLRSLGSLRSWKMQKNPRLQTTLQTSWLFGDMDDAPFFDTRERFNISFTIAYRPRALSDVSVFLNAYSGKDYYNMHFQQRLSVVRVGLQAFAFR